MKFLVIGGAGYVGSHFVFEALQQGHECLVYDNLSTGHKAAVPAKALFVYGDIKETNNLLSTLLEFEPDVVLHYAALALVGESVSNPSLYYQNNIEGTRSLIEALYLYSKTSNESAPPLIFSSTCAVFGSPTSLPINEGANKNPESPYGFTKYVCEKLLEDSSRAYGLKATALRYFNACGAHSTGLIGEKHDPETHLIPNVLRAIQGGRPIQIFGNDYPTKDGTCIRDYIHVTDLAISHLEAARWMTKKDGPCFTAINLGTGTGYSNLEIVKTAGEVVGKKVEIEFVGRRPGDADALYADSTFAKKLLGFAPKHSSLENIISTSWTFIQNDEALKAIDFK